MIKQLIKTNIKVAGVSIGNIVNALLGLAFLTAVARSLNLSDFGVYSLLTTVLVLTSKIIDFGTNSIFVTRAIAQESQKDLKNTFITSKVLLYCIALLVTLVFLIISDLFTLEIVILYILGLFAYGINYTLFAFFQKEEQFHFAVGLNFLPAVFKGFFALFILAGIFEVTLLSAFAIFALSIFASTGLLKFLPQNYKNFEWHLAGVKKLLQESYPAGVALTINNGWSALANTATKLTHTFTAVGVFSLADKVANIFSLVSFSIFTVLLPKNAKKNKSNQKYDFAETIFLACGILLAAAFATFIATVGVPLVFGQKFAGSIALLGILIFAAAFTAITTFVENYFFVKNKANSLLYISLVRVGTFFLFIALLTPVYAIKGIAYAQLVSALLAFGTTLVLIGKDINKA